MTCGMVAGPDIPSGSTRTLGETCKENTAGSKLWKGYKPCRWSAEKIWWNCRFFIVSWKCAAGQQQQWCERVGLDLIWQVAARPRQAQSLEVQDPVSGCSDRNWSGKSMQITCAWCEWTMAWPRCHGKMVLGNLWNSPFCRQLGKTIVLVPRNSISLSVEKVALGLHVSSVFKQFYQFSKKSSRRFMPCQIRLRSFAEADFTWPPKWPWQWPGGRRRHQSIGAAAGAQLWLCCGQMAG